MGEHEGPATTIADSSDGCDDPIGEIAGSRRIFAAIDYLHQRPRPPLEPNHLGARS
jgi:hypothetical protein